MSRFIKSLSALGAVMLVFLTTTALRSIHDSKAGSLDKTLSPCLPVVSGGSDMSVPVKPGHDQEPAMILAIKGLKAKGALRPEVVRKVLAADLARLGKCYEEAADKAVPLPSKITLVFKVGPDGKLTGVPLGKPPLANLNFESYLASAFRTLQFPAFKGTPVQVEVTLALAA
ncbi:MAG: AgmX/PglI C-terminal domain-containing protein [Deltaproteobacteria bacterium]|nr:AgmX/PglI C-terminal domain-containing protein [Deltaproteobacteria bacterium]